MKGRPRGIPEAKLRRASGRLNAVRTIPEITQVFPNTRTWSIAARGSEEQLAMAEWLLQQLDQPAATPGQVRTEQKFQRSIQKAPNCG